MGHMDKTSLKAGKVAGLAFALASVALIGQAQESVPEVPSGMRLEAYSPSMNPGVEIPAEQGAAPLEFVGQLPGAMAASQRPSAALPPAGARPAAPAASGAGALKGLQSAGDIHDNIKAAFDRVSKLKYMENDGRKYSLSSRGETFTGISDDFLRRRTAYEILSSGLTCGCGDFATSFYNLMRQRGFKALYLDAVQLTASSLLNRDNGHTGVAVQDPETGQWILVDPTAQKIVAENWDVHSKIYEDQFWIWYLGQIEDYPAKDHPSLKAYYDQALKSIPASVWNERLIRLDFEASPSMRFADGSFTNPRGAQFMDRFGRVYTDIGINPKRRVKIIFSDDSINTTGKDCQHIDPQTFECFVKRSAGMSFGWFRWIEEYVNRNIDKQVFSPRSSNQDSPSQKSEARQSAADLLNFVTDNSMRLSDGTWLNPTLPHFIASHSTARQADGNREIIPDDPSNPFASVAAPRGRPKGYEPGVILLTMRRSAFTQVTDRRGEWRGRIRKFIRAAGYEVTSGIPLISSEENPELAAVAIRVREGQEEATARNLPGNYSTKIAKAQRLKRNADLAAIAKNLMKESSAGEKEAAPATDSAEFAINPETRANIQDAFRALRKKGMPGIEWKERGVMLIDDRYVPVSLSQDGAAPDGYEYDALIPVGAEVPYLPSQDPNKQEYFILRRFKRSAGPHGLSSYSNLISMNGAKAVPGARSDTRGESYESRDLPKKNPVRREVERMDIRKGRSGRLIFPGKADDEAVSATAVRQFKDMFSASEDRETDHPVTVAVLPLDKAVKQAGINLEQGLYGASSDEIVRRRERASAARLARSLGKPAGVLAVSVKTKSVVEGKGGKPSAFGYVLFVNRITGEYAAVYTEEGADGDTHPPR